MDKIKSNQFVRGWNYGNIQATKDEIIFDCNDQSWFKIPYSEVSNVIIPAKNELSIEFILDENDGK
jgi:hypothetical protein